MLAVLNRYKLFLIILTLIVLAIMVILFITSQNSEKVPSRGTFVMLGSLFNV